MRLHAKWTKNRLNLALTCWQALKENGCEKQLRFSLFPVGLVSAISLISLVMFQNFYYKCNIPTIVWFAVHFADIPRPSFEKCVPNYAGEEVPILTGQFPKPN